MARLERLQKLQRTISGEIMAAQVGREVEVLVEGPSQDDATKRFGRTPENRTVNFEGDAPSGRAGARCASSAPAASALSGVAGRHRGSRCR